MVPLAAAAVVVLVAGATLAFLATSTRRVPPGPSVTEWVAPTAPLMESPARALFATPSVTKSVIDRFIPPATIFKGD